jgi:hypothetical protein
MEIERYQKIDYNILIDYCPVHCRPGGHAKCEPSTTRKVCISVMSKIKYYSDLPIREMYSILSSRLDDVYDRRQSMQAEREPQTWTISAYRSALGEIVLHGLRLWQFPGSLMSNINKEGRPNQRTSVYIKSPHV